MAAGKDIEIDRLLMNNDRVGGSSRSHLETSLHMKASELEAASLALIEDKDRHRKPSHDVRHTFYGMFEKQEFRYDILQQEIAALPTIYNETGRNTRSAAGGHASKQASGEPVVHALKAAKSKGGKHKHAAHLPPGSSAHPAPSRAPAARIANIFRSMNQLADDAHLASAHFPFYPALITKSFGVGDFERAIMGHYKLPLSCLPPAFYSLPCVHGGTSLGRLAEESYLQHRIFLVVLWRPSSPAGQTVAKHYELLALKFPQLVTVVHVLCPKYADEKAYLNSMPGGVPQHLFMDEQGHMAHELLGGHPESGGGGGLGGGDIQQSQKLKLKLPAVLMCLPNDSGSTAEGGGVASLQPQFAVQGAESSVAGTAGSTSSLSSTTGNAEYYNCHTVLFAVQDTRCISSVAGFAVGALLGMYCSAHRPGQYLQEEVTMVVTDPSWAQATWLTSRELGDSFVATKGEHGFYTESVARMPTTGVESAQMDMVALLGNVSDMDLAGDAESKDQQQLELKEYAPLEPLQQAHLEVVQGMLDHCVGGSGGESFDCLQRFMEILPPLSEAAPAAMQEAYAEKLERYSDCWKCLHDTVSPCGGSDRPARFLPFLYQGQEGADVHAGMAQASGMSLGMLQHLQKKLFDNVYIAEYIQQKRELRQRYSPSSYLSSGDTSAIMDSNSPSMLSSPSPSMGGGGGAEGLLEPEWDAIFYNLRMGQHEAAYNIAKDFVAPTTHSLLSRSFSNEVGDESALTNTTASLSNAGDTMRTTRSLGSRGRYQRYQRLQQRGKSRTVSGKSPEDREALLENVRTVLRALVVASGSLHAQGALGVREVRHAVEGIWEHILEHQRALKAERKEQRYYEHAHRYDGDNIGGGTPIRSSGDSVHGSGGSSSTKKGRRGSGGGAGSAFPATPTTEQQSTHVQEVNAHKQCVLLLLTTCGSNCLTPAEPADEALPEDGGAGQGLNLLDALQKAEGADLQQQDVLWAFVWEMYWGRAFYDAAAHESGQDLAAAVDSSLPPVYKGLTPQGLYSQVLDWGGGLYFDPIHAAPYDYVRVLLCCQQFAAAVAHLRYIKQTVPAVHLACACLYLGLLSPLDPLCEEVQDGQGHVVDLLESGATVSSFVEEYALATNVEPSVSATYLLMSLVPQCLSAEAMQQNSSPLKFQLRVFLGSFERLHLHVGSFAATRELVRGLLSHYVRDSAVLGVLVAGLGHRVLAAHRRVGEAMRIYQLAGELSADDSTGSGSKFLQGIEEVLLEASRQLYSVLLSAHSQQRLYARAAAKAILQQIQGEDGDIRSDVAAPPGASRARVLGLCGDLANLEAFCLVIDICVEVDRMGGAGRVDVQDILANKFLQVKWALRSPPHSRADGRGVEVVGLVPSSAQAVSHISSALIRQLTTEQAKLYDEALAHTASYLQRLIQFVQSGKGSSGSVLTDNATSNELRSLVARVSAVRDSIEVSTESYVNNAAGITNWADPKPPKVAGGHGKHATSGKHGSVVAFADSVGELQHHTPHTKQHPRSALPTSADSAPTFNAALELESEYEQAQFSVYSAQAAQQQEHLRIQLSEQLSSKKGSKVRFGLPNLGNSCYLSCIVQCLAHITPLAAYLVGSEYQPVYTTSDASLTFPPSDEHCITHRLAALLSVVSGPAGASATPTLEREWLAFTRSVRLLNHRSFDNASQQDAEEFLGWLLTRIEAELKLGRQETPLVQRMFSFARRCNWTCEKCGRHSTGPTEADSRLMVQRNPAAGQGSSTLKDWLEYTTRWETGCSHNCHDPACGGTTATMRYSIEQSSLPAILTIALQRSQSVDDKDETAVDFPVQGLDMQPYCDGLGGTAVYDLFAFCNHVGGPSLRSGHYLAYARDSKGMSETWSEFDDAKVTSVRSIDDLLSAEHTQNDNNTHAENYYSGTNHTNRDARRDVYILFYKKRTA